MWQNFVKAASGRAIPGRTPAAGAKGSKNLTSHVMDNAMKRPVVQATLDKAIADMVLLQAGTHALCEGGHLYNEDEALGLVLQQV
jgi:hypothetical protein